MVMVTLAEPVLQQLAGDLDLARGHALPELQLIAQGKIEAQQVLDMVGDGMIAVADDPADIAPDL